MIPDLLINLLYLIIGATIGVAGTRVNNILEKKKELKNWFTKKLRDLEEMKVLSQTSETCSIGNMSLSIEVFPSQNSDYSISSLQNKVNSFLEDIKKNQNEVVYYCCNHLLSKKYNINEDSVEEEVLKDEEVKAETQEED